MWSETSRGRTVTVCRSGQEVLIRPACPALPRNLRTRLCQVKPGDGPGYRAAVATVLRFATQHVAVVSALCCGAGLEPAVRQLLTRAGYDVDVRDVEGPLWPLPEPAPVRLGRLPPLNVHFLRCVRDHPQAVVRVGPRPVDPARLVAQIAHAWPDRTVAVAVARRDDARRVAGQLHRLDVPASAVTGQDAPAEVERVVVATFSGLLHSATYRGHRHKAFDLAWVDVVVALDAVEAVGTAAMEVLVKARRGRLYGLLGCEPRPAPWSAT